MDNDKELTSLLETTEAERLATGFRFTEGPLWDPDGFLYFVDLPADRLYRIVPGSAPELVRDNTGEGNGTTFDLDGRLIDLIIASAEIWSKLWLALVQSESLAK